LRFSPFLRLRFPPLLFDEEDDFAFAFSTEDDFVFAFPAGFAFTTDFTFDPRQGSDFPAGFFFVEAASLRAGAFFVVTCLSWQARLTTLKEEGQHRN
jgi:hypothetical protein